MYDTSWKLVYGALNNKIGRGSGIHRRRSRNDNGNKNRCRSSLVKKPKTFDEKAIKNLRHCHHDEDSREQ